VASEPSGARSYRGTHPPGFTNWSPPSPARSSCGGPGPAGYPTGPHQAQPRGWVPSVPASLTLPSSQATSRCRRAAARLPRPGGHASGPPADRLVGAAGGPTTARVGPGMDHTSSTRTHRRQPTPTGVDPWPSGWRQSRPPERSWPPTASGRRQVSSRLERGGDRRGQPHSVGRLRQQLRSRIRRPLFVRSPADLPRFTGSVK
jgi:hypothetical protein